MKLNSTKKIYHKALLFYSWFIRFFTAILPDASFTMRFRGWLYSFGMKQCGKDLQVGAGARLLGLQHMSFGEHCYISPGCVFLISCDLKVADQVLFGPYVVVADGDHTLYRGAYRYGKRRELPIVIGHGCWIASHVTLTKGSKLGDRVLVGANSVVTGITVSSGHKVAGVPAKNRD